MRFHEITETEAEVFKRSACDLAQLDGKNPLAIANNGLPEWRAYVPEVQRLVTILNGLTSASSVRVSLADSVLK